MKPSYYLLLPRPESILFQSDLLGESLAKGFLLFLPLGIGDSLDPKLIMNIAICESVPCVLIETVTISLVHTQRESILRFANLACLHLGIAIVLVVRLFRRANKVQHVCADQQLTKFLEVAMVFILD